MRVSMYGIVLLVSVAVVGCQQGDNGSLSPPRSETLPSAAADAKNPSAMPVATSANPQNMAALPLEVRSAFQRDYPGVNLTSATVQTGTGATPLYRVGFLRDGQVTMITYDATGTVVVPPAVPIEAPNP